MTQLTLNPHEFMTIPQPDRDALATWMDELVAAEGFTHRDIASVTWESTGECTVHVWLRNELGQRYLSADRDGAADRWLTVTPTRASPVDIAAHLAWMNNPARIISRTVA